MLNNMRPKKNTIKDFLDSISDNELQQLLDSIPNIKTKDLNLLFKLASGRRSSEKGVRKEIWSSIFKEVQLEKNKRLKDNLNRDILLKESESINMEILS